MSENLPTLNSALRKAIAQASGKQEHIDDTLVENFEFIGRAMLGDTQPLDIKFQPETALEHAREFRPIRGRALVKLNFHARAGIEDLVLQDCEFVNMDFSSMSLKRTRFERCLLVAVKFHNTDCTDARFDDSTLVAHDFEESLLENTSFDRARLQGCLFSHCAHGRLGRVSFRGANLTGSNFERLELDTVSLDDVIARMCWMPGVYFRQCSLQMAKLGGSHIQGSKFDCCRLDFADFNWAILNDSYFGMDEQSEATTARFANFSEAALQRAKFSTVDLTGADFSGADLRETRFEGCVLLGCNFERASVGPETFSNNCNTDYVITSHLTQGKEYLTAGTIDVSSDQSNSA